MKVAVHRVESIANEVEAIQHRIANRAEELHDASGAGRPLDDWLAAERETIWRPAMEVQQTDGAYLLEAAVAGLEPREIDVRVAPGDVLISANVHHHHQHTDCPYTARSVGGTRRAGISPVAPMQRPHSLETSTSHRAAAPGRLS